MTVDARDRADLAWVADNGDHGAWDFEAWAVADLQLGLAGQLAHAELHAMTDEEYAALRDGPELDEVALRVCVERWGDNGTARAAVCSIAHTLRRRFRAEQRRRHHAGLAV